MGPGQAFKKRIVVILPPYVGDNCQLMMVVARGYLELFTLDKYIGTVGIIGALSLSVNNRK